MQNSAEPATVLLVSNRLPERALAEDIEAHGFVVQWARGIKAAVALLSSANGNTVIVTELAVGDGNWRDLVEQVRRTHRPTPIVLLTASSTAELWWDALECGVDDIVHGPIMGSRLCQLLDP